MDAVGCSGIGTASLPQFSVLSSQSVVYYLVPAGPILDTCADGSGSHPKGGSRRSSAGVSIRGAPGCAHGNICAATAAAGYSFAPCAASPLLVVPHRPRVLSLR